MSGLLITRITILRINLGTFPKIRSRIKIEKGDSIEDLMTFNRPYSVSRGCADRIRSVLIMITEKFLELAEDLEVSGLLWMPEIGDEISSKDQPGQVSVLVDPAGKTPRELRSSYLWLPTVEQMVMQFEARQAVLFHAGLEISDAAIFYKTVIRSPLGQFESKANSIRLSIGIALRDLLTNRTADSTLH